MDDPTGARAESELVRFLELTGLSAFVLAQPVFDLVGKSPETFSFYGAERAWIVAFAIGVVAVPPAVLWLLGRAAAVAGKGARRHAHTVAVALLCAILGFQIVKALGSPPAPVVTLLGVAFGTAAAALLIKGARLRRWLPLTAIAAVPFLTAFLIFSPVSDLVLPSRTVPGAAATTPVRGVPVVMVVFDQLPTASLVDPRGNIDRRRYPSFARLAEDATWFRQFTAEALYTRWALPSLLTGKLPVSESALRLRDHPRNLFTLLGNTHQVRHFGAVRHLCPPEICNRPEPASGPGRAETARDVDLETLLGDVAAAWWAISAPYHVEQDPGLQFVEETTGEAPGSGRSWDSFLGALDASPDPFLAYKHIILPHYPWRTFPSTRRYDPLRVERVEKAALDLSRGPVLLSDERQWPMRLQRQRHLLQIQRVDRLLGDLLDRLEETGLYDRTLLIVTSDHGLLSNGGFGEANLHEVLYAPLFVKTPGQRTGRIDDAGVTGVDLLPTIADVLDTRVPWDIDGTSAFASDAHGDPVRTFDDPQTPDRDEGLRLPLAEGLRRMRRDAFRPDVEGADPRLLLYRIGPGAALIGEQVDPSSVGPPATARAVLSQSADAFQGVDLEGQLPALVLGSLSGGRRGQLVAASLNGRVAAVAPAYLRRGEVRFSFLIPDLLFRDGRNELKLYLLEGSELRPLAVA